MAKTQELLNKINAGELDVALARLYSDTSAARARYARLCERFLARYGDMSDARFFSAPGRCELCGNHTDHNLGRVVAAAVDLDTVVLAAPAKDSLMRLDSEGYSEIVISARELEPKQSERGSSAALVRGVAAALSTDGRDIVGFFACADSQVLPGSGLSSSAAFEVALAKVIATFAGDKAADALQLAAAGKYAENEYYGKPCGMMDQTASAVGGLTLIDFGRPQSVSAQKLSAASLLNGLTMCTLDTAAAHDDLTDDYAAVPAEMKSVAAYFNKNVLREVDEDSFWPQLEPLRAACGDRAVLRAIHFYNEMRNVGRLANAIESANTDEFLRCINASGYSSFMYNQNIYSPAVPQRQPLSVALALSRHALAGRGACRVHGGGFAGTILAFVPNEIYAEYAAAQSAVFGAGCCRQLNVRQYGAVSI